MRFKQILSLAVLFGVLAALGGCSTDENPITPEKMSELRKQEGDQRANFNPETNKPRGQ